MKNLIIPMLPAVLFCNLMAQPFDLTVNLSISPHVGQALKLRVVDVETNTEVGREEVASIVSADVVMSFTGILESGKSYNVDFYADANGNEMYDAPPADHAWREVIPSVSGDATLDWGHNASFTDVEFPDEPPVTDPGPYDLSVVLSITPHTGQALKLRVVDTETSEQVAMDEVDAIVGGAVVMSFTDILEAGKDYNVDWYADNNENGQYDAPPADHAWRQTISGAAADAVIDWSHTGTFTDIEFPNDPAAVELFDKKVPIQVIMDAGKLNLSVYIPADLKVVWVTVNGQVKSTSKFKLDGKTNVSLPLPRNANIGKIFLNGKLTGVARIR